MTTLEDVRSAYDDANRAGKVYADATARLHRLVADALSEGVRAVDIAAALNITRGRVYQLKDAAERKAEQ